MLGTTPEHGDLFTAACHWHVLATVSIPVVLNVTPTFFSEAETWVDTFPTVDTST